MATVRAPDGGGGYDRADTVIGVVWARIKTMSVMEANTYSQLQERATHKAMIRHRDDIDQGQTVYWMERGAVEPVIGATEVPGGKPLYVITAIDADPDNRPGEFLELILREGGNL